MKKILFLVGDPSIVPKALESLGEQEVRIDLYHPAGSSEAFVERSLMLCSELREQGIKAALAPHWGSLESARIAKEEYDLCVVSDKDLVGQVQGMARLVFVVPDLPPGKEGSASQANSARTRKNSKPTRNILHVHNVRRCGGTGNFVLDMADCWPDYYHHALCVNDPRGDPEWIRGASRSVRTFYSPLLTKKILEEIDPFLVFLHATPGSKLEGEWPYGWLRDGGRRYVVSVHHVPTYPLLPADMSLFVSNHVKKSYEKFLGREIRKWAVMPPCTNVEVYKKVGVPDKFEFRATTGGKTSSDLLRLIARGVPGWTFCDKPPGKLGAFPRYLAGFSFLVMWSGHQETWCRTVTEAMAAGRIVIAHRSGAIPEQVFHGENGFLFSNEGELLELLTGKIPSMSQGELRRIAERGAAWADKNFGFDRMRSDLAGVFAEALSRH